MPSERSEVQNPAMGRNLDIDFFSMRTPNPPLEP